LKMGLKCVAVYRDNCKVGQPLTVKTATSDDKASASASVEVVPAKSAPVPYRHRLERQRAAMTTSFTVGGADGYLTTGAFEDGSLGEVFLKIAKPGSTLAGVMDALAISISMGLQYGVPLETYASKFLNTRFEPAGMTNDPDIRFASSLMDYVFRRMALDYLPVDVREQLGVMSVAERTLAVSDRYGDDSAAASADVPVEPASAPIAVAVPVNAGEAADHLRRTLSAGHDAPMCLTCGITMVRAGSCFCCPQCSTTSGCS